MRIGVQTESPRRGISVFAGGADQKREKEKGKKEKENGNAGFSSLVGRGAAMAVAWLLLLVLVVLVLLPVLLPAASLGAGETIISQHPHRAGPIRSGATAESNEDAENGSEPSGRKRALVEQRPCILS